MESNKVWKEVLAAFIAISALSLGSLTNATLGNTGTDVRAEHSQQRMVIREVDLNQQDQQALGSYLQESQLSDGLFFVTPQGRVLFVSAKDNAVIQYIKMQLEQHTDGPNGGRSQNRAEPPGGGRGKRADPPGGDGLKQKEKLLEQRADPPHGERGRQDGPKTVEGQNGINGA